MIVIPDGYEIFNLLNTDTGMGMIEGMNTKYREYPDYNM